MRAVPRYVQGSETLFKKRMMWLEVVRNVEDDV